MRMCIFCKFRYQKGCNRSFHKFPTDFTKELWLRNSKHLKVNPKSSVVCSKHFTDDCFIKESTRIVLKIGSVPTIFLGAEKVETDPSPTSRLLDGQEIIQDSTDPLSTSPIKREELITSPIHCGSELKRKRSSIDLKKNGINLDESKPLATSQPFNERETPQYSTDPLPTSTIKREELITPPIPCGSEIRRKLGSINLKQNNSNMNDPVTSCVSDIWHSVKHDHIYENTLKSYKDELCRVKNALKKSRARIKVLSQNVKRLKVNVSRLKVVIRDLKKKELVSDNCVHMLSQYDHFKPQLLKRMLKNIDKNMSHAKFAPDLRSFAITLYFYSPKAYAYVRNKCDLALPHPRVIRSWYNSVDANPGFSVEKAPPRKKEGRN